MDSFDSYYFDEKPGGVIDWHVVKKNIATPKRGHREFETLMEITLEAVKFLDIWKKARHKDK